MRLGQGYSPSYPLSALDAGVPRYASQTCLLFLHMLNYRGYTVVSFSGLWCC